MEKCSRCGKSSEEVRLFDTLEVGLSRTICERCSLLSGIPIVKRPSINQLRNSEKPLGVRERLLRLNHLDSGEKRENSIIEEIKKLEEQPELEKPEDLVFKLVDNFRWVIQMERRRKGLTIKQLAEALRESESALNLLEKGIVPSKSFELIQELEQFLKIRLIKRDLIEKLEEQKKRDAIVDSLLVHKKEEITVPLKIEQEMTPDEAKLEAKPLNFRKGIIEHAKIRDLQKLNDKIEKDFSFETKTREEVGNEQVVSMGGEDIEELKKTVYKNVETKIDSKSKNNTPSIYELMKKKEEKDKAILGKGIEIVETSSIKSIVDNSVEKTDKEKWDELE